MQGVAINWVTDDFIGGVVWGADGAKVMNSILDLLSVKCHSDMVQRSSRHLSMEFRREAWAGDMNVGIFSR